LKRKNIFRHLVFQHFANITQQKSAGKKLPGKEMRTNQRCGAFLLHQNGETYV